MPPKVPKKKEYTRKKRAKVIASASARPVNDPNELIKEIAPKLPIKRLPALEVLCAGGKIVDAAKAAGVDESAVRYWLETADFRGVLDAVRAAHFTRARIKCAAMVDDALGVVEEAMAPSLRKLKKGEMRNPLNTRLAAVRMVFDAIGLMTRDAEPVEFNEDEIEEVLRRRGWVKKGEA